MATSLSRHLVLGLALTGATVAAACDGMLGETSEHREVLASECVVCHQSDYDRAAQTEAGTLMDHGSFPTDCVRCHSTAAWKPATFDHGHVQPDQCVGCHQEDYDATTSPAHPGTFPTSCVDCHTTSAWKPATFDHSWPLDGKHLEIPCSSCHTGEPPVYAGTPKECVGCHQEDYDTSPYPGHEAFSTDCAKCHTTTTWEGASAHPNVRFPLSGPHGGIECAECHDRAAGPDGPDNTDCVGCHSGRHAREGRDGMDFVHIDDHDVAGYPDRGTPAPPNFCLRCHEDGRN